MPPSVVAVDLCELAPDGSNGGAARFVLPLLSALGATGEFRLWLLVREAAASFAAAAVPQADEILVLGAPRMPREPRLADRLSRRLPFDPHPLLPHPRPLRSRGAAALFSPLQSAVFAERGLPHVAVAYDFQEITHPGFFSRSARRRRRRFRAALTRCERVIAISEATRSVAIGILGIPGERVRLVHPSGPLERTPVPADALRSRLEALGLTAGTYFLYPANAWPHKNHDQLLAILDSEHTGAGDGRIAPVLCGLDRSGLGRLEARVREARLDGRIRLLGVAPDPDLTALLQGARFLFFPSLFEGFGLPVLEAIRLGTPVACSDLPALREVAGDAALYFDPTTAGSMAAALCRMTDDEALRSDLRARGLARATLFPAGGTVEALAKELRSVLL
jgi:glycosyltransferase involved in cell wall biosynthesis